MREWTKIRTFDNRIEYVNGIKAMGYDTIEFLFLKNFKCEHNMFSLKVFSKHHIMKCNLRVINIWVTVVRIKNK